jgi:hypothetical protein
MADSTCYSSGGKAHLQAEDIANKLITGVAVAGFLYRITVEVGFIVPQSVYDTDVYFVGRKPYFQKFGEPSRCKIAEVSEPLILIGATRTEPMKNAKTMAELVAAIFRRPMTEEERQKGIVVNKEVRDGLLKALKNKESLGVVLFAPRGGIPDDIYEELAERLYDAGANWVYGQDYVYDRAYYKMRTQASS